MKLKEYKMKKLLFPALILLILPLIIVSCYTKVRVPLNTQAEQKEYVPRAYPHYYYDGFNNPWDYYNYYPYWYDDNYYNNPYNYYGDHNGDHHYYHDGSGIRPRTDLPSKRSEKQENTSQDKQSFDNKASENKTSTPTEQSTPSQNNTNTNSNSSDKKDEKPKHDSHSLPSKR
jgi:hypothetical protein